MGRNQTQVRAAATNLRPSLAIQTNEKTHATTNAALNLRASHRSRTATLACRRVVRSAQSTRWVAQSNDVTRRCLRHN